MKNRNDAFPVFVATPAELGAAVRWARVSMGLSIEQAAAATGVPPKTLVEIEIGAGDVCLNDAMRVASLCGLELLAQPRGTNALGKILSAETPVEAPAAETSKAETAKR